MLVGLHVLFCSFCRCLVFEFDVRLCCDCVCNVGACFCIAAFVLSLVFGFNVRLCCDWICKVGFLCFIVDVDDCCLDLVLDYVVIGYVK